jgi:hypothetical protein
MSPFKSAAVRPREADKDDPAAIAEITDQDVIELTGPEFLIDRLWKREFGQQVENRYRILAYHLIYMRRKYGPVITHSVFIASVQDVCALEKEKNGIREKQRLGEESADNLVREAVRLGLITKIQKAKGDGRVTLYTMTNDQVAKLYRIRRGTEEAFEITEAQSANPDDSECGRNEENKEWCANIKTEKVMKHDGKYRETKTLLDRWRHLAPAIAAGGALGLMLYLAQMAEVVARTIDGTGY